MLYCFKDISNVFYVEGFIQQFLDVTTEKIGKPPEQRYEKWLMRMILLLIDLRPNETHNVNFEKLKNTNLFSIRNPKSKINQRVIYYVHNSNIILLDIFKEKSSTDYSNAIVRANNLLAKIME